MTPLELLVDEVKNSKSLKAMILNNIHDKGKKKMSFNVTNLIFDFKAGAVEIQDEIGIADYRIQKATIDEFVLLLTTLNETNK